MKFWSGIIKGSRVLWVLIAALMFCSIIIMGSASSQIAFKSDHLLDPLFSHLRFLLGGLVWMIILSNVHYKVIRIFSYPLIAVSLILLIITPFVGNEVNGAVRSLTIFGIEFQPLEFGKISVVLLLSDTLSRHVNNKEMSPREFAFISLLTCAFCALIAVQNLSTAVMLFVVAFSLMIVGRVNFKYIAVLCASLLFVLLLGFAVISLFPDSVPRRMATWVNRIENFSQEISADKDDAGRYVITEDNFQIMNSKIAIANGKTPSGPGNSEQRDYLPLAFSDFIFAVCVEEYGILGALLIITIYMGILITGGQTARRCDRAYPALLVVGLSIMITLQALISMAVTVQLGPVTGQPLPLISRGGTSIFVTSTYLGIMLSISQYVRDIKAGPEKAADGTADRVEAPEETVDLQTLAAGDAKAAPEA